MLTSTDQHVLSQPAPPPKDVWNRRLVYLHIIFITMILVSILFWFSSKIIVVLLIFLIAALLAYAVVPVVDLLHRFMPGFLATALVYLVAIAAFGFLTIGRAVEIKPVVSLLAVIAGSELFGIWGVILAAPTMGLIQAFVRADWQYYQKTHAQEFPLQQLEQRANPQGGKMPSAMNEPALDEPWPR